MKVEDGVIRQIKITDVKGLDSIRVMIEEYDVGQAKVIIECYGESWSSYWGSMGGDVKEFFARVNVPYLVNCFDRGIRSTTDEIDTQDMKDTFIKEVRATVLEQRRDWSLEKDEARTVYNECVELAEHLDNIAPKHPYDYWDYSESYWVCESSWERVFYDRECFTDWMENHCPYTYMKNHQYEYLSRIVSVVKEVISGVKEEDNG